MKKNIIKLLTVLMMLLNICGCGSKSLDSTIQGKWEYVDNVYFKFINENEVEYYKQSVTQIGDKFTEHIYVFYGIYTIESEDTVRVVLKEEGELGSSTRTKTNETIILKYIDGAKGEKALQFYSTTSSVDTYADFKSEFYKK